MTSGNGKGVGLAFPLLRDDSGFAAAGGEPPAALRLGPLVLDLRAGDRSSLEAAAADYGEHLCRPASDAVLHFLLPGDIPSSDLAALREELGDCGRVRGLPAAPGLRQGEAAVVRSDFVLLIDAERGRGRALLLSEGPSAMDAVVRVAASLLLPRLDALLVHAGSFERAGRGIVALGPSGSGKSTLCALSGRPVLNDEISLLAAGPDGSLAVWGTPFARRLWPGSNRSLPVERLLVLAKDEAALLEDIPSFDQMTAFLRNVIQYAPDIESFDLVSGLAGRMLAARPLQRLRFAKTGSFMEVMPCP